MPKNAATVMFDGMAKFAASLKFLAENEVLVGVPEDKTERKDAGGGITNAALAAIHTNGAPEVGIPARPYLVPGIRAKKAAIADGFEKVARAALKGDAGAVDRALHSVGLIAQNAVRNEITKGLEPELKPKTLAARRRRGRTGTKPLYDTGALLKANVYVVRKRKK